VENGRNAGWKMERSKGGKWSQRWVENGTIYIKGEIGNFFKIFSQKHRRVENGTKCLKRWVEKGIKYLERRVEKGLFHILRWGENGMKF
jgi:hypothetical protein